MKYLILCFLLLCFFIAGNSQTNKWKVVWKPNPENNIKEYVIYRDNIEVSRVKSPDSIFVDSDIIPGILYKYQIQAVNTINLAGPFSDPAVAAIPAFKDLPNKLGISKDKPTELLLKNYIYDPDDSNHEISRINVNPSSKVNLNLQSGKLIIAANDNWQQNDVDTIEIKISDSKGFYNIAKIIIQDLVVLNEIEQKIKSYNKINLFPEDFSVSQYNSLKISHIPENCNLMINNSFGELVYSEKNVDNLFEWDAEDNHGDKVLFGLYNVILLDASGSVVFKKSFRVIP